MSTLITAAESILGVDTEPGGPSAQQYEAHCRTCGETSGAAEGERLPAELWALKHTGRHPSHRMYQAVQTSHWRVTPAPGNPYRGDAS
ncbi:DUF7848 domain-containing protein [Streptomyces sp. NPDC054841]